MAFIPENNVQVFIPAILNTGNKGVCLSRLREWE